MNILVACEESQVVCLSFRKKGHAAYSCDLQYCSGNHPEYHIMSDVKIILNGGIFKTCDGEYHNVKSWDMIIAHPPCTYLSNAGACRLYPKKGILDYNRFQKGLAAKEFFNLFYYNSCAKIAIENPIPSYIYGLPTATQLIEPYQFGEPYTKRTLLWLKGLPPLFSTNIVIPHCSYTSLHRSSKLRSKTFPGIAAAMANQWG